MSTLHITRGLPGSGKTTYAREWVAADPTRRARVNRDDIRTMLHGDRLGTRWQEDQVTVVQDAAVEALLRAEMDVICDDTNLGKADMIRWQRLATNAGATLAVIDLRHVPQDVCIARDAARGAAGGRLVGAEVIRAMAARSGRVLIPPD